MSEARELFERFRAELNEVRQFLDDAEEKRTARIYQAMGECVRRALATQPEPGAVPELPEWLELDEHEDWRVTFEGGHRFWIDPSLPPDDLDRIAEACRVLAARERARRAGS